MDDPRVLKYERMLTAMPREFRALATWGWTELRPSIHKHAIDAGATPAEAAIIASRLARLVVGQMYQDIMLARQVPKGTP